MPVLNDPILRKIPENLKNNVFEHLFDDILYNFKIFFSNFHEIKFDIVRYLIPRIFSKNENILNEGEIVKEVNFITRGSISIGITISELYSPFFHINKPLIIGDFYIFTGIPSIATYKADETVHGYSILKSTLAFYTAPYKENIEKYIKNLVGNYQTIQKAVNETLNSGPQETKEKEEHGNLKVECNNFNVNDCVVPLNYSEKSNTKILDKIEETNKGLKKLKKIRTDLLWELKEKLANHVSKSLD